MKKGTKIIVTVFAMVMVLSTMVVGIWAATVQVASFGATVTFTSVDVSFDLLAEAAGSKIPVAPLSRTVLPEDTGEEIQWSASTEFDASTKDIITIYYAFISNTPEGSLKYTIIAGYDFDAGSQVDVKTYTKTVASYTGTRSITAIKTAGHFDIGTTQVSNYATGLNKTTTGSNALYTIKIELSNKSWLTSILTGAAAIDFSLEVTKP